MRFKDNRDIQKSMYSIGGWLKWARRKTYGDPIEEVDLVDPDDTVADTTEDDYQGADHD